MNNKSNKNYFYLDGRTLKKYYCKDCSKEICYENKRKGKGRCSSCCKKGNRNPIKKKYLKILTKKFLQKEYISKKLSIKKIANKIKVNSITVYNYLKYYRIKKRKTINKGKNNPFYGKHHNKKTKKLISKKAKIRLSIPENNPNYLNGKSNEPYPLEFNNQLKESIRKRDNYTCQNCSMTEEEHLIVMGKMLLIHHIDYNKQNCSKENLITLCHWCNIRANYNRKYWKEFYQRKIKCLKKQSL